MLKILNCDGANVMTISTRRNKKSVSEGKNPTNEGGIGIKCHVQRKVNFVMQKKVSTGFVKS